MPRGSKSKAAGKPSAAKGTDAATKDEGVTRESDMTGAAIKTTRGGKRAADGELAGAAMKKIRPIVPISVAAALAKIKHWKESRGYSEGHTIQVSSAPATWTTEICSDPNKTGCVENLRSLRTADGLHQCFKGCQSEEFREIFFAKGMTIIDINGDGKEHSAQLKHAQFVKLFPDMTIEKFDDLKSDEQAFASFVKKQFEGKRFDCRIFVWIDPNDSDRYSLTLFPE